MVVMRAFPAHPRVGGENFHDLRHTGLTIGSSPRRRGKRDGGRGGEGRCGLIPA